MLYPLSYGGSGGDLWSRHLYILTVFYAQEQGARQSPESPPRPWWAHPRRVRFGLRAHQLEAMRPVDTDIGVEERPHRTDGQIDITRTRRLVGRVHRQLRAAHVDRMHARLYVRQVAQRGPAGHVAAIREGLERHVRTAAQGLSLIHI